MIEDGILVGKDDKSSPRSGRARIVSKRPYPAVDLRPYPHLRRPGNDRTGPSQATLSSISPTLMKTGPKKRAEPSEARTRPRTAAYRCVLDAHTLRHALDSLDAPLEGKRREHVVQPVAFALVPPVVLVAPILDPGSGAGILHLVHSGLLFCGPGPRSVTSTRGGHLRYAAMVHY